MVSPELMMAWMALALIAALSLLLWFFDSNLEKNLKGKIARIWDGIMHWCREFGASKTANPNVCRREGNDCGAKSG